MTQNCAIRVSCSHQEPLSGLPLFWVRARTLNGVSYYNNNNNNSNNNQCRKIVRSRYPARSLTTTTTTTTTIDDAKLCDQRILLEQLCVMIVNAKLPKMRARLLYLFVCYFYFFSFVGKTKHEILIGLR